MSGSRIAPAGSLLLAGALITGVTGTATAAPRKSAVRPPAKAKAAPAKAKAGSAKAAPKSLPPASTAAVKDLVSLDVAPASGTLDGPRASQHLIALGTLKDGSVRDVTDLVTFSPSDPKLLKVERGVAHPQADGQVRVVAKLGKVTSRPSDFTIRNSKAPATIEFVNDVMPILSKAGCNNTACHGSPAGKGALKLSLFGYEPELDHPAVVKAGDGKLVDPKDPAKSLFLQKPLMGVPHAGGQRFKPGSAEHATLLAWLKEGAPGIGEFEARVQRVEAVPDQPWLPTPGAKQRLIITAHLSDGTTRDVTDKAIYSSNDDAVAEVSEAGQVTARRAGETAVMVRYMGQVAVSRIAVLPSWKLASYPKVPAFNYVDELVQTKLKKLRVVPSDLTTDEEFIRRATLDVCGIIPTPDEVRAFVADQTPDKRAKLIDKLLERPEYVDLWTMKWNDILRNNPQQTRLGAGHYAKWIEEQVKKNRPYDEFVRDLLKATGKNSDLVLDVNDLPRQLQRRPNAARLVEQINAAEFNAPSNYYLVSRDPLDVTSATSQIFLGVRVECARCHNHPFEKWTQNDYYGLAAFFTGYRVFGNNQAPRVVMPRGGRETLRHPKTNEVVEPRPLDGAEVKIARGGDRRAAIADWITSPENPFFSRAIVNRIWAHYMGRGIVEPVDDFRVTNPPSNPELLDALGRDLVAKKFDLKEIHRVILNSRTYQQSSRPNQYNRDDTSNFARFYPKRMMAEQLYDSISQATGVFLPGLVNNRRRNVQALAGGLAAKALRQMMPDGPVSRVMELPAVPAGGRGNNGDVNRFLQAFGKPRREVVCECERSPEGNMGQALALLNGSAVNDKIAARNGRVQELIRSGKSDPEVIEELYFATLSRRPNSTELNEAATLIKSAKSRGEGIEDLAWGLLNSREFLFNH